MKSVVVYKSRYGTTATYAKWLADALHADLFEASKVKVDTLLSYDTIVYGGGLYAGGISGVSLISKNFEKLKDKKIIIFTVGLANPQNEDTVKHILNAADQAFIPKVKNQITFFHLRGGIDYSKLNLMHKAMMALLKAGLNKKDDEYLTEDDKGFLETYGQKVSFLDQKTLTPIVDFVHKLS